MDQAVNENEELQVRKCKKKRKRALNQTWIYFYITTDYVFCSYVKIIIKIFKKDLTKSYQIPFLNLHQNLRIQQNSLNFTTF